MVRNILLIIFSVVGINFISITPAWGWSSDHSVIAQVAVDCLPDWQKAMIKDQIKPFVDSYCCYPDWAADPQAKPYIMPDFAPGEPRLHCPHSRESNEEIIGYYLPRIHSAFKENRIEEALKWFGALTHFLEDSTCPAHIAYGYGDKIYIPPPNGPIFTYLEVFKRQMPMSDAKRTVSFHGLIEDYPIPVDGLREAVKGYQPSLLGADIPELGFYLGERHQQDSAKSAARLYPIMAAIADDDRKTFVNEDTLAAARGVKLVADTIYSILMIVANKCSPSMMPAEVNLGDFDLTPAPNSLWSLSHKNCFYIQKPFYTPPFNKSFEGVVELKEIPLKLKMDNGSVRVFKKGYGIRPKLSHMSVSTDYLFFLPPGEFKTFSAYVGHQAELGGEGTATFEIVLDDKVAASSGVMQGTSPAKLLEAPLGQARKLTIKTKCTGDLDKCFPVWGDPVLKK